MRKKKNSCATVLKKIEQRFLIVDLKIEQRFKIVDIKIEQRFQIVDIETGNVSRSQT